jgi:hypothetical protein
MWLPRCMVVRARCHWHACTRTAPCIAAPLHDDSIRSCSRCALPASPPAGFDGVDLDYEPSNPACTVVSGAVRCSTDTEIAQVTTALRTALPKGRYILSTASWYAAAGVAWGRALDSSLPACVQPYACSWFVQAFLPPLRTVLTLCSVASQARGLLRRGRVCRIQADEHLHGRQPGHGQERGRPTAGSDQHHVVRRGQRHQPCGQPHRVRPARVFPRPQGRLPQRRHRHWCAPGCSCWAACLAWGTSPLMSCI